MESNKSKCLECKKVYTWVGYKTGIGKTQAQLLQMAHKNYTCQYCGSKTLYTGLNWDGSDYYDEKNDVSNYDPSILTSHETQRAMKEFLQIEPSIYQCKHCGGNYFTPIRTWVDTDGNHILLYCMDCKTRSAHERNWDDVIIASKSTKPVEVEVDNTCSSIKNLEPVYPGDDSVDIGVVIYSNTSKRSPRMFDGPDRAHKALCWTLSQIAGHEGWEPKAMGFGVHEEIDRVRPMLSKCIKEAVMKVCNEPDVSKMDFLVYSKTAKRSYIRFLDDPVEFEEISEIDFKIIWMISKIKYQRGDIIRFRRKATDKFPEVEDIGQIISMEYNDMDGWNVEYGIETSAFPGKLIMCSEDCILGTINTGK